MAWRFRDGIPIYQQITERILTDIVSGNCLPGEKLPSVRELAAEAAVNPNTVQKAMAELEAKGLISAQRTAGRFVTEESEAIAQHRREIAREKTSEYLKAISRLGYGSEDAGKLIDENREGHENSGKNS